MPPSCSNPPQINVSISPKHSTSPVIQLNCNCNSPLISIDGVNVSYFSHKRIAQTSDAPNSRLFILHILDQFHLQDQTL